MDYEDDESDSEREVAIPEGGLTERLDIWLAAVCPDLSRARIQALIKSGRITWNDQSVKPNAKPKSGVVRIMIPPPISAIPEPQDIPLDIIYEDPHFLVLNKPAGLVVHPAPGHPDGTLVNALLFHCGDLRGIGGVERPGIVHRLDKDTSGLLVVAKSDAAMAGFVRLFKSRGVCREYLAWVCGKPPKASGTVRNLIGRHPIHRQKMAVVETNGKLAITHYQIEKEVGDYTLVRCRIETGRTHQVRVHMQFLGCPIVGDPVYGRRTADQKLNPRPSRQLLHAEHLSFPHPITHLPMDFHAPLPPDM